MKLSPLVWLVVMACLTGAVVGALIGLRQKMRISKAGDLFTAPYVYLPRSDWSIKRTADDGQYVIEYLQSGYAVAQPTSTWSGHEGEGAADDSQLWDSLLRPSVSRNEFLSALDLSERIEDDTQRADALAFITSRIAEEPPLFREPKLPITYRGHLYEPDLAAEPAAENDEVSSTDNEREATERERQAQLAAFVSRKAKEVRRAIALARNLPSSKNKMIILLNAADVHRAIGDSAAASKTAAEAVSVFSQCQRLQSSIWGQLKSVSGTIITWVAASGGAVLIAATFWRVAVSYLVDALAHKIGDERFATALGITLRTVEKSKIIVSD